jgi:hypothetical protein
MTEIRLIKNDIIQYYEKVFNSVADSDKLGIPDTFDKDVAEILGLLEESYPGPDFKWSNIGETDTHAWLLREWLFCKILLLVGDMKGYVLKRFGSTSPRSDIDISVEGTRVSVPIRRITETWVSETGYFPSRLDISFYGDFVMYADVSDKKAFLNTRNFKNTDAISKILPYVGASIYRNTGALDFMELTVFLTNYPQIKSNIHWKEDAIKLIGEVENVKTQGGEQGLLDEYCELLDEAEALMPHTPMNYETTLAVFLALCKANLYTAENYILPSTVIHIVRDIQARALNKGEDDCERYHVYSPKCALSPLMYLFSAMEQIGYIEHFKNNKYKRHKYQQRYMDAIQQYNIHMKGGRRRAPKKHTRRRILNVLLRRVMRTFRSRRR